MAGDDDVDRQAGEHFQGCPRCRDAVGLAEQFRENHAEAVFPQRIAGNQDALFRVVVGQRFHVVTGNRNRLPVQPAHLQFAAGSDQPVVLEARCLLSQWRQQQRFLVPFGDGCMQASRDDDLAAEPGLYGSIAANVVGVRMGVYQAIEASTAQGFANQRDGLGGMGDVAAVDQRRLVTIEAQDVVRRQPAAFENLQAVRKLHTHSELSGSRPCVGILATG